MRCVKDKTVEQIIEGGSLKIDGLKIGDGESTVILFNKCGRLTFGFNNQSDPNLKDRIDYSIIIDKEGIRFERFVYRPNHDHNSQEYLQVVVDPKGPHRKKGELVWSEDWPVGRDNGYGVFYVPFGMIKVDY